MLSVGADTCFLFFYSLVKEVFRPDKEVIK